MLGRLAKDPEIRYTQGAEPMCVSRFTLAVDRRFKKEGEQDVDFIYCVTFRRTAEFMERYIKKGMQISLCGSLQVRSYEDSSGQRKWSTEVIADEVNFAESRAAFEARMAKGGGEYSSSMPTAPPQPVSPEFKAITESIDEDDDLPF